GVPAPRPQRALHARRPAFDVRDAARSRRRAPVRPDRGSRRGDAAAQRQPGAQDPRLAVHEGGPLARRGRPLPRPDAGGDQLRGQVARGGDGHRPGAQATRRGPAVSGYVALDGPDGSGKSTQAERLVAALRAEGRDVVHLREPGSTVFGERLRETLLDPRVGRLDAVTEVLAFSAARREMLVREVAPARARGADVVVERCFAATLVYQGIAAAEPAPLDWIEQVTAAVVAGIVPDVVVLLDVDAAVATARRPAARDRIEAAGAAFHERVVE